MGACISQNHRKESYQQAATSPTGIRAEINAQLRRGQPVQSHVKPFYREKESRADKRKGEEQQQGVESKQVGLQEIGERQEDVNSSSLNTVELGNDSGVRVIRHVVISKNCLNMLKQSCKNQSIKSQQNTSSPSQIINCQQQPTFHNYNQIQTIQSRIQHIDQNMLGRGLTVADNKMIQLTLLVTKPLNLSAVKFKNGSTYYGEWCKGQREGYGVLVWQDGSKYEGEWHLNCSQGQGKLFYNKREHYEGQFLKNGRHGYGVYVNNEKNYKGQWKNDKKQGLGIETWDNKQYYEGQWLAGKKNGYGQLYFEDGSYYKGIFSSNQIHGHGFYQWKNSRSYEGQWEHNTMCGKGILKWTNGDQYQGCFKNNKMHGNGIFTHADGRVSEGSYQNGKKQGIFVQINQQKKAVQVEYLMGKVRVRKMKRKQHKRTDSNTLSSVTNSV